MPQSLPQAPPAPAVPYGTGSAFAYDTNAGTAAAFGHRDAVAPNSHVTTSGKALSLADRYLDENNSEDFTITFSAKVNEAVVTLIHAGDVVNCHFTHLPGFTYPSGQSINYDTQLWPCRITNLTYEQNELSDQWYMLRLNVSPIPAGGG